MQTSLRLDDQLYRRAKAMAAELGVSLTRFLEDSLRQQIQSSTTPHRKRLIRLPVSKASGGPAKGFRSIDDAVKAAKLTAASLS